MIEFALVAVIFFTLVFAVVNGALLVLANTTLTNAAREAARYGVATSHACTTAAVTPAAQAQAGPFSTLSVSASTGVDGAGGYCQVTVTYPFHPFGGFPLLGAVTVSSTSHEYDN